MSLKALLCLHTASKCVWQVRGLFSDSLSLSLSLSVSCSPHIHLTRALLVEVKGCITDQTLPLYIEATQPLHVAKLQGARRIGSALLGNRTDYCGLQLTPNS